MIAKIARSLVLTAGVVIFAACGSSDGSAKITVNSDFADDSEPPGAEIGFSVRTENFQLVDPHSRAIAASGDAGHYHVYLDGAEESDSHLTGWTAAGTYKLPADLAAGDHSLRFELCDGNHDPIGTGDSEDLIVFSVR